MDAVCTDERQVYEWDKNCATRLSSMILKSGAAQFSALVIVPLLDQLKQPESRSKIRSMATANVIIASSIYS